MLDLLRAEFALIKSDPKTLRSFGIVMCSALMPVAVYLGWRAGWQLTTASAVTGSFAIAFATMAIIAPRRLRGIHRAWMMFAMLLGFVMTRVILTIVFFLVVTPIGIALRLFSKDPLAKGPDPTLRSYWITKEYRTRDRERLKKYY